MLYKIHRFSHQLVIYLLLFSLFLQSCYNPVIPSLPVTPKSSANHSSYKRYQPVFSAHLITEHTELVNQGDLNLASVDSADSSAVMTPSIGVNSNEYIASSVPANPLLNSPQPVDNSIQAAIEESAIRYRETPVQSIKNSSQRLRARKSIRVAAKQHAGHSSQPNSSLYNWLKGQICIAQDGYQVKFVEQASGLLQAIVEHAYFKEIPARILPVIVAPGTSYAESLVSNLTWQKYHIHVMSDHVYVGSRGLLGGTLQTGAASGTKKDEKEQVQVKKSIKIEKANNSNNTTKQFGNTDLSNKISTKKDEKKQGKEEKVKISKNNNSTSQSEADKDKLWQQLLNITTQDIQSTVSNSWSKAEEINKVLDDILKDKIHLLHPDLSSIYSPADSNQSSAMNGAVNYVEAMQDRIKLDGGSLQKPIIAIINTKSAGPSEKNNASKEGGIHWQTCVVLPKGYKSLGGNELNNQAEIIFYIDAFQPKQKIPALLLKFLKEGFQGIVEVEGKEHEKKITALSSNLEVKDSLGVQQQVDGWSCGWWAVYNALMIVYTGDTTYLTQFTKVNSKDLQTVAYKLRTLLPDLGQQEIAQKSGQEKGGSKAIPSANSTSPNTSNDFRKGDSRLVPEDLTPDGLKSTLHGDLYQLGLLTLAAIRAHNAERSFHLVSEAKECEKFDDLVIDYGDEITFLQAKHSSKDPKEDGYKKKDFCAGPDGEFSLAKYFDSWHRLTESKYIQKEDGQQKSSKFILFTNRYITDADAYLELTGKIKSDEFLFEGLETKDFKFKKGESRAEFMDAIRAYSQEVKNHGKADEKASINSNPLDLVSLDTELGKAAKYLQKKYQNKDDKDKTLKVDGRSRLSTKAEALLGLVKTNQAVRKAIASKVTVKGFNNWLDTVEIKTNVNNPYAVLAAPMEKEIQQFLDELIIKVEQPSVSKLSEILAAEFKLSTKIGVQELFHTLHNKMFEWLSERKTCLMKSGEFYDMVEVKKGDLHRFYLLGSTQLYEQAFQNYPLNLVGLEVPNLADFLDPSNKSSMLALIQDTGSGGIDARVYQTVKTFCKDQRVKDADWAFISIESSYFKELADVLKGPSTKFMIVDCRSKDGFSEDDKEVFEVAKKNNKKLVLLLNDQQKKQLISWLGSENKTPNRKRKYDNQDTPSYSKFNLDALTDKQVQHACDQYKNKGLCIGGKYSSLSSILANKKGGLYKQLTNIDALQGILPSLVKESKQPLDSGLPYDIYVESDLVPGIPCYSLLYLLKTVQADWFIIEGTNKPVIKGWLKENLKSHIVFEKEEGSEDTRYRLVNNLEETFTNGEKLICISDGKEIKHDSYVRLKIISQQDGGYECTLQSKADQVRLPIPSRYDFGKEVEDDQEKVEHTESKFLKQQKPAFSILTAHAGHGKSAFCLKQRATWCNSKEEGLPAWVVRINLPQITLSEKPSFKEVFTFSATGEEWPAWKLKALQEDMEMSGRVFLFLDGLDEIKDEKDVQALNNWLQILHPSTSVLITTRPYAAHKIVPNNAYKLVNCMTLKAYNAAQQQKYIQTYLQKLSEEVAKTDGLGQLTEDQLSLFTNEVHKQLKLLLHQSTSRLLGIPLETYIFCEALRPHIKKQWPKKHHSTSDIIPSSEPLSPIFISALSGNNRSDLGEDTVSKPAIKEKQESRKISDISICKDWEKLNPAALYQNFILVKLQMFLQKHMQMDANRALKLNHRVYTFTASYTDVLMTFAFKQAFNLPYYRLSMMLQKTHYRAELIQELSDTGLVSVLERNNEYILKFNHETYQEYFAALYMLKILAERTGNSYEEAKRMIIESRYIPKYRMIMFMAAQVSLSNDPIIPAWDQHDEEQIKNFWKILATPDDILGIAHAKFLRECLRGLLPGQMEKLSKILVGCDWAEKVLMYISQLEELEYDEDKVEEKDSQGIDVPFTGETTQLSGEQELKMSEQERDRLKDTLKDKSKVVAATREAIAKYNAADIAEIFENIVQEESYTSRYWDIDGGFQAMALLGSSFSMQHANYFVERITNDPSWRVGSVFAAMQSLLKQNLQYEAKKACLSVILCLLEQQDHIENRRNICAMAKICFKPMVELLKDKIQADLLNQTMSEKIRTWQGADIDNCPLSKLLLSTPLDNFIKMMNLAYQSEYAVVPTKDYSEIQLIGDTQVNFKLEEGPLVEISKDLISQVLKLYIDIVGKDRKQNLSIKEWQEKSLELFNEDCEKSVLHIVDSDQQMREKWFSWWKNKFNREFGMVHDSPHTLYKLYEGMSRYNLIEKEHVDRFVALLTEKLPAYDKYSYWSIDGGIAVTQFCWRYFNQNIADYLVYRAGCWNNNVIKVKEILEVIREKLLKNPNNDECYAAAIQAFNYAATEVNKKFDKEDTNIALLNSPLIKRKKELE